MDDNDVCPLCCEELDLSDRQFFPCKCGYQVCMWCWHRIRESESGLCPACRTPYGDDPHEFSAVDMEEVLKANKEKAAAEKRERERLRQQQAASALGAGGSAAMGYASGALGPNGAGGVGGMHIGGGSDGDLALAMGSSSVNRVSLEPPKDRNQLANMRVIRRNLVYAVGLPPSIATEETLRKPEYFGQYGKISKIVINRNHNGNGDPRRASASAYVTFLHKEDTLACILALDGFYHDGRNIRASYGTSKYCSAFIKAVRCNNPDCTYLHCMGDAEDTFTKQEIQAGYVTSGRDVLARQQQLMAAAASGSGDGAKRRVGGGGPSGTGKSPSNPVFPPPCFDEPQKRSTSGSAIGNTTSSSAAFSGAAHSSLGRSVSIGTGFSAVAAGVAAPSAAAVAAGKVPRSISMPTPNPAAATAQAAVVGGPPSASTAPGSATTSEKLSRQQEQLRRMHPQNKGTVTAIGKATPAATGQKNATGNVGNSKSGSSSLAVGSVPVGGPPPATAASVVAGVHQTGTSSSGPISTQPPAHTTLTPLTPLKRASSLPVSAKGNSSSAAPSTKSSGANANNAPSSSSGGADAVQLPPNMPIPKGLTPAEQMAIMEQRKEAMAAVARQQREMAMKLSALRSGSSSNASANGAIAGTNSSTSSPSVSSTHEPTIPPIKGPAPEHDGTKGAGVIGGTVISGSGSAPVGAGVVGAGAVGSAIGRRNTAPISASIGGLSGLNAVGSRASSVVGHSGSPLDLGSIVGANTSSGSGSGALGGEAIGTTNGSENIGGGAFAPQPSSSSLLVSNIGDKWGSAAQGHGSGTGNLFGGSGGFGIGGTGIWSNDGPAPPQGQVPIGKPAGPGGSFSSVGVVGGGVSNGGLGGGRAVGDAPIHGAPTAVGGGSLLGKNPFAGENHNSGSSALASMLGINLPTGSGSLRESSSLWEASSPTQPPVGGLSSNSAMPGAIGPGPKPSGGSLGGIPIGRGGASSVPIGGFGAVNNSMTNVGNSNKSDIAMLQSLLPGVHITSGNAHQPAAPVTSSGNGTIGGGGGWGSVSGSVSGFAPPPPSQQQRSNIPIGVGSLNQGNVDTWGNAGLYSAAPGAPAGSVSHDGGQQQRQGSIW